MIALQSAGIPIGSVVLQFSGTTAEVLEAAAQIVGLAVLAAAVAGSVAIAFRWYARERVSNPPAVLLGVAVVALYLNATTALGQIIAPPIDGANVLTVRAATFNVTALVAGIIAGLIGVAVGDRLARTVFGATGPIAVDQSLSRVVRAVGRVITVELPAEIDDVPGYDPVDPDTKATLEGKTFVFPRGLTVEELRERLQQRLREDYRVGHIDIEIDENGTVTHLGLGSRAAGIGPTLPPESAAMAIRADPAHAASAGDLVQVWARDPQERICNAEVRGTAGEVVTIAIDAADASKLDTEGQYKLVTLPVEERADRELTELLRAADETLGVVEIAQWSSLAGAPIGALDLTVVAVHSGGPGDRIEALPARDRVLTPGDSLYVIARPADIRRLESAANATEETAEHASSTIPSVTDRVPHDPSATTADRDTTEEVSPDDRDTDEEEQPADPPSEETTESSSDEPSQKSPAVETEQPDEDVATDTADVTEQTSADKAEDESEQTDDEQSGDDPERSGESESADEPEREFNSLFGGTTEDDTDRTARDEPSDETDQTVADEGNQMTADASVDEVDQTITEESEDDAEQTDTGLFGGSDEEAEQIDEWESMTEGEQTDELESDEEVEQTEMSFDEDLAEMDELTDMEDLTGLEDPIDADDEESVDRDPD